MTSPTPPTDADPADPGPSDTDDPYVVSYRNPSHPFLFLGLLGAVMVCALFGATIVLPQFTVVAKSTDLGLVSTPVLIGLDEASAVAAINAAGLAADVDRQPNFTAPPGEVTYQTPGPGARVTAGTTIKLSVSAGSGFSLVPELQGSPRDELEWILLANGLTLGELTYAEDDTPLDETLAQTPTAGKLVPSGTPVNITLSAGPPLIEIPDVSDLEPAWAHLVLLDVGFVTDTQTDHSWSVRAGEVMATEPAAGEAIPRGSLVTVIVSDGPPPTTTRAPRPSTTQAPRPPTTQPPSTTRPPTTSAPQPTQPPATTAPPPATAPPPPAYEPYQSNPGPGQGPSGASGPGQSEE